MAGGYNLGADNVTLTPTPLLVAAFDFIDEAMGAIVNTLKAEGLYESTTLIITAKHGQSPRNPTLVRHSHYHDHNTTRWQHVPCQSFWVLQSGILHQRASHAASTLRLFEPQLDAQYCCID